MRCNAEIYEISSFKASKINILYYHRLLWLLTCERDCLDNALNFTDLGSLSLLSSVLFVAASGSIESSEPCACYQPSQPYLPTQPIFPGDPRFTFTLFGVFPASRSSSLSLDLSQILLNSAFKAITCYIFHGWVSFPGHQIPMICIYALGWQVSHYQPKKISALRHLNLLFSHGQPYSFTKFCFFTFHVSRTGAISSHQSSASRTTAPRERHLERVHAFLSDLCPVFSHANVCHHQQTEKHKKAMTVHQGKQSIMACTWERT